MKQRKMNDFGIIVLIFQSGANVLHLLWTVWLVWEQIQTEWGYGTSMELAVLFPWLTEILCAPVLVAALVYLLLCVRQEGQKNVGLANLVLFFLLLVQYGLTNLFIWF